MLAVLVACSKAVLADEGNRLPKSQLVRRLLATAAFPVTSLFLAGASSVITAGIAGMGHNPIQIEDGRRVAHFGVPFRLATSNIDESPYDVSEPLGTDAWWNPREVPTEFEETAFRRSTGAVFALVSLFTLLPSVGARDARTRRRRA